jgi:hypothetical protein
MIKLKDILLEGKPSTIFIPRRIEGRVERMIKTYIRNGNKGNLNLQDLNLTVLPEMLKDITVDGDFYCGNNNLTSLENCPKTVSGVFGCSSNKLISLEGAPKFVGEDFMCRFNPGKFTEKDIRAVCDVKGEVLALPKKLPRLKKI